MGKIIKTIIRLIVIIIILLAAIILCFGKDKKSEPKHTESFQIEKEENNEYDDNEIQEEVIELEEEQEEEEEVEEETESEEVIDNNSIRPEFKKSMEDYEAFFDEYIEFMNAFKEDSTSVTMIAKYADFLVKYEKAMTELSNIDESELTEAEDKLFLETQLRISNKLAEAAINY